MITCEFRIPIRAETAFYSNVKLAAFSLAALSDIYSTAPLSVTFGGDVDLARVLADNPWSKAFPNLRWRPAPPVRIHPEFASALARYDTPATADVVILMDADACLLRPIDDLMKTLSSTQGPAAAALQAHASPFHSENEGNDAVWHALLDDFGLAEIPLDQRYYWYPKGHIGGCPATYFNFGFVAFNRAGFDAVRTLAASLTEEIFNRFADRPTAFFSAQIALALSLLLAIGLQRNGRALIVN